MTKMVAESDLGRFLDNAQSVALGGMLLENRPSGLVRWLISSSLQDLFVTSSPAASWDVDVLVAAGCVARVRIPHISLGSLGLAPAVREAARTGTVQFEECDEAMLIGGYLAAATNVRMQVLDHLGHNDVTDRNSLLEHEGALTGVRPLRVDVALLHAPLGDEAGNLVHLGSRYADLLMARAADIVVAQVDREVSRETTSRLGVSVPGYLVDAVVEMPFAAHPTGSAGAYVADLEHIRGYQRDVSQGRIDSYLDRHCRSKMGAAGEAGPSRNRLRLLEKEAY